ncbi:Os12g0569800 [Oryza sativa Japonica Group]|uniref:Os12g0569800 protein n=1 Tax=Oryza sativa subsp. japonica TaxID=39947 RepID=A0A0P0YBK7_ORYSJ|nr:hypothetical protein EE612_060376 [Oryza sativa]BAT17728.1 Os12g0569800 [Oryza sativa Japonica Group]
MVSWSSPIALVHLDQHTRPVVGVGGEDRPAPSRSSLLWPSPDQDGGLDSGAIGDGLIRVDVLAELLAIEEVLEELLHSGNPGGATNKDEHRARCSLSILVSPHALPEEIHGQLLEPGAGDVRVEVDALVQGVNLNGGWSGKWRGESPLRPLTSCPQPPDRPWVASDVLLALPLELLNKVLHHSVVKVLTTKMRVTSCGLDLPPQW